MIQKIKRPLSIILSVLMVVSLFTIVPITASATELPDVIKDCTYKQADSEVYANVPFMPDDASDYSSLVDGAIYAGGDPRTIVLGDAKGYSYKFYDQTGTEIAANLAGSSDTPGSQAGLTDDVTLYKKHFRLANPVDKLYIVATAPEPAAEPITVVWNSYTGEFDQSIVKLTDATLFVDMDGCVVGDDNSTGTFKTDAGVFTKIQISGGQGGFNGEGWSVGTWTGESSSVPFTGRLTNNEQEAEFTITFTIVPATEPASQPTSEPTSTAPATEPATEPTTAPVEETITINSGTDKLSNHGIQNLHYGAHSDFNGNGLPWGTFVAPTGKVFTKIVTNGTDDAMNWTGSAERVEHDGMMGEWYIDYDTDEDGFRPFTISFTLTDAPATTEPPTEPDPATVVAAMINALPDPANVTLEDEAKVNAAMAAYMVLTDAEKQKIDAATLQKLTDAEAKINDLTAAKAVTDAITALPAAADLTLDNAEAVTDAKAAYDALTADQKKLVATADVVKLNAAVAKIADLTAAKAVIDAIEALPAPEALALTDAKAVEDARAAYNALTDAQKALVDADTLTALSNAETKIADLTAAKTITDQINALPAVDNLTLNNELDVVAARQAYNALTDAQKALVDADALTKLADAETRIADLTAARPVIDAINALPATDSIALTDAKAVEDARADYNALTDAQKALIDADTLQKLTDAETKIEDLTAAKMITDQINALPAVENITLNDELDVVAARQAYDLLTDAQKALVDADALTKLTDAETKITDLTAAQAVTDAIAALPNADAVTLESTKAVTDARDAYEALTPAQKAMVSADSLTKLADVEQKIADLTSAKNVTDLINGFSDPLTLADKEAVESARLAYDALTDDQKELVTDETLQKLTDAEAVVSDLEIENVDSKIKALPPVTELTVDDRAAIDDAKAAYDALTDEQKDAIPTRSKTKLAAELIAIAALEKDAADHAAADPVTEMINALPSAGAITAADKPAVDEASAAYDALTDDQKAMVPFLAKVKLTMVKGAADAAVKIAEDEAAADAVEDMINALPSADNVTVEDKEAIEAAQEAYNALTDDQKRLVTLVNRAKLAADAGALAAALDEAAADAVEALIEALPTAANVKAEDKDAIEEAQAAYDALTNGQKQLIPLTDRVKLAAVTGALAGALDEKAADEVEAMIEALPGAAAVTIEDKEAIDAAQAAYDALTTEQKRRVTLVNRVKLTADQAAIAKIENDIAAADAVKELINALPEQVTLDDIDAITEARNAYENLTDDQKALVEPETLDKLDAAEAALSKLLEAETVKALINDLPAAEDVTANDLSAIENARGAYDLLTPEQQAEIDAETLAKLTDAETAAAKIKDDMEAANDVSTLINALPNALSITTEDRPAFDEAAAAYDALTDDQKAYVPFADRLKLTFVKAALENAEQVAADEAAADEVEALIEALPAADAVTLDDKAAIEEARAAYDALSPAQKRMVTLADRLKLTLDEAAIAKLENDVAEADAVKAMINDLPAAEDVTIEDLEGITAARNAYDDLTDDQKALIDADTLGKLEADEAALAKKIETETVKGLINDLPAAEDVTVRDTTAIENARGAYDLLTPEQQAEIDDETLAKLTDAEAALALIQEDIAAAAAVEEMIDALPAATRVTLNDKDAIEEAAAAYDALTDAQKEYVPFTDKLKLALVQAALDAAEKNAADEAAADEVEAMIDALPAPADVTIENKEAIEAARAAYDALTNAQKRLVTLVDRVKLTLDETALEKIENDIAAAEAVTDMINALPAPEDVTVEDLEAITAARNAYDDLTDDQKALVAPETLDKLAAAEEALGKKLETEFVKNMINELPAAEDVTVRDTTAIENAREAYDLLTPEQQAEIDDETLAKLTDAEAALALIQEDIAAAAAVEEMIDALPAATRVTLNDKDAIEEAAAAYDALTDAQKEYVPFTDKVKLALVQAALDAAEKNAADEAAADEVEAMIDALPAPSDVTIENKEAIEAARAAYDALTNAQKRLVTLVDRVKLTLDETALEKIENDIAAAEAVTDMINALPAPEDVTVEDLEAITAARNAYDDLTDDQKALVAPETLDKLAAAEEALGKKLETESVKNMINELPAAEDVTVRDTTAIENAREAYDLLTPEQQAEIDDETLAKLTDAEAALKAIQDDIAAAEAVEALIDALPNPANVTVDDKEAIEEAVAAYDALTDAQKSYVPVIDKVKLALDQAALELAEKVAADEAAAAAVEELIEALPAPDEVTLENKQAIDEAAAAYDALTPEQKALVSLYDKVKLAFDQAAIAKAEFDKAAADAVTDQINALPAVEDLTPADADAVQAAREAFDALTDAQKEFIDDETIAKLVNAEDRVSRFVTLGDVNGDGVVDVRDVTAIQRYLAEALELDEVHQNAADVNRDGFVNVEDATVLEAFLAEYAVEYPIGETV